MDFGWPPARVGDAPLNDTAIFESSINRRFVLKDLLMSGPRHAFLLAALIWATSCGPLLHAASYEEVLNATAKEVAGFLKDKSTSVVTEYHLRCRRGQAEASASIRPSRICCNRSALDCREAGELFPGRRIQREPFGQGAARREAHRLHSGCRQSEPERHRSSARSGRSEGPGRGVGRIRDTDRPDHPEDQTRGRAENAAAKDCLGPSDC